MLARNRATLLTCGVPAVVYENKRNWWYFVEHGYFAPEGSVSIVYVDTMPRDDALRLCLFLEREEAHRVHKSSALTRLQFLLGRQPVRQDDAE